MIIPHPPNYTEVVRANAQRTTAFVLGDAGTCARIRDDEARYVRRVIRPLSSADLEGLVPPESWVLAMLLCPGDQTTTIARWAGALPPRERARIRFYHVPDVDLVEALAAWYEAGFAGVIVEDVHDFASFHKLFGATLSTQIYLDATGMQR